MQEQALLADHDVLDPAAADPHLTHLQRFPVKSLDPEIRETATLVTAGALEGDREWATLDRPADVTGSDDYVNGKKTDAVHRIRSTFHPRSEGSPAVTLRRNDEDPDDARRFQLHDGRADENGGGGDSDGGRPIDADRERTVHAALNDWLSDHFGRPVSVRWDGTGQQDDRQRHGPTVVSTATLREVAAWFDFDLASARRRFRANLEIGGVPPFWEDRLFVDEGEVVAFRVGDGVVEGIHPCQRCVVPGRDPDTGAETPDFRETFVQRRRETCPEWTDCDRYDHDFRLMVNTRVPEDSAGVEVEVGDSVEILERRPE